LDFEEKRTRRRLALLLISACLIPFANGLTGNFTYDDKAIVRDNVRIQSPSTLGQIFETSYFGGPRGSGTAYRPMLLLSYAVQWWIHGRRAMPFHAVNLLLHTAATLLLWALFRRLRVAPAAAFAAALLFAAHPIHVEAVTSLVGRGETQAAVLALFFLLLALRTSEQIRWRAPALAGAGALYLLALLTKESAATAPVLAFLCFFRLAEGGPWRRLRDALRRGLPLYAICAAVLAGYFGLREWVLGGWIRAGKTGIFEVENPLASLGAPARIGNACLVLLRYLGRIVFPLRLSADESAWSIRPVAAASALAIGAVLLLALAAAAALLRPRSAAAFGFLFFGLAMLPASNLLFPIGTIYAERVAYLPSAGICLIAAAALVGSAERIAAVAPARLSALAAVALLLSVRTAIRDTVWSSDEALFENSVRVSPASAKNHYNLGYIRAEHFRFREGLEAYRRATRIYDKYWDAWAGVGRCERELGMLSAARRSYERALQALPTYENGFFGLGLVLEEQGRDREALETYRKGLAKNPTSLPLAFRVATVETRLSEASAGKSWRQALAAHPGSLPIRFGYANRLRAQGEGEASRRELRRILAAAPYDAPALRLLAEENAEAGRYFAAALAREKVFRATRASGDLLLLLDAASSDPAYRCRFAAARPRLERLAPWAFRYAESCGALSADLRPPASPGCASGG
jgi:tetratricopeptide (TPR) repeat protein